jgi:hypothetical protein
MQESLGINYDAKIEVIRDEIVALAKLSHSDETSTQTAQLASLKTKLEILEKERAACIKQTQIIRSLYFPVLRRRWNQIPDADQASNEWVFNTSLTPFKSWLTSRKDSDGLFCITGKVSIPGVSLL